MLSNVDQDLISRIMIVAKFLHDHETDLSDANIQFDGANGLKSRLAGMAKAGQDELDAIPGLGGMSISELNDIAFVITSLVQGNVTNGRTALAATRKVT